VEGQGCWALYSSYQGTGRDKKRLCRTPIITQKGGSATRWLTMRQTISTVHNDIASCLDVFSLIGKLLHVTSNHFSMSLCDLLNTSSPVGE